MCHLQSQKLFTWDHEAEMWKEAATHLKQQAQQIWNDAHVDATKQEEEKVVDEKLEKRKQREVRYM